MRRLLVVMLSVLLPVLPAKGAERPAQPSRIAVMSAFVPELEALKARTRHRREHVVDGVVFVTGELEGKPVVLFLSGVSMVNAARSTQLALDRFRVRRIVFSGVGGGVDPALGVGDVVVPAQWAEYLEMTFARQTADGYAAPAGGGQATPNFGMMYPSPVSIARPAARSELRTWFPADPRMLAAAGRAAADVKLAQCQAGRCLPKAPTIRVGGNGVSGSAFVDNAAFRQYAFTAFNAEVLDMESAAVAQVAYQNRTPFIAFRSLSDLAGGDPGANQFPLFVGLAADNAATVVRRFLRLLP
jgi:adenosylhomocysteine nucleosidase